MKSGNTPAPCGDAPAHYHSLSGRRIVFVSTMRGVPWGGSEDLWSQTALALRQRGCSVSASVVGWPEVPAPVAELKRNGISVTARPQRRSFPGRLLQNLLKRWRPGPLEPASLRWLQRQKAELVVISQGGPWDGVPWMRACRALNLRYCTIVHANSELWWPLDAHLDDLREGYSGARRAFFVSKANLRLLELQAGMRLPHAAVIANPCKVARAHAVPWPCGETPLTLACVGRLSPNAKGQDVLLETLALEKWRQRPLRLHLYGTGPSERSLKSLALLLGLTQVSFEGHVSDVTKIWARHHALILPSRFEGLPLTILEAMLCGRPVITTNVAGNAEVVTEGETGFIAEAPTVPLLDAALERAWLRRDAWKSLGESARLAALRYIPADATGIFADQLLGLCPPVQNELEDSTRAKPSFAAVKPTLHLSP